MSDHQDNSTADSISFILLCGLTGLLCLAALFCCIYMCCLRLTKTRRSRQRVTIALRNCKTVRFKKNMKISSSTTSETCVICLEDFSFGSRITICPCEHTFHESCLYNWVRSTPVCPVCKQRLCEHIPTVVEETTPLLENV